jgi:hypothetical protein
MSCPVNDLRSVPPGGGPLARPATPSSCRRAMPGRTTARRLPLGSAWSLGTGSPGGDPPDSSSSAGGRSISGSPCGQTAGAGRRRGGARGWAALLEQRPKLIDRQFVRKPYRSSLPGRCGRGACARHRRRTAGALGRRPRSARPRAGSARRSSVCPPAGTVAADHGGGQRSGRAGDGVRAGPTALPRRAVVGAAPAWRRPVGALIGPGAGLALGSLLRSRRRGLSRVG